MTVRTIRVECWKFAGGDSVKLDRWKSVAEEIKCAYNTLWRVWLTYHELHRTEDLVRHELDANRKWEETKEGDKPKFEAKPFPETDPATWPYARQPRGQKTAKNPEGKPGNPKLEGDMYHILQARFPMVSARSLDLLLHKWKKTVESRKSSNGMLPGWKSILLGRESVPSFTRPLPIPFDLRNAKKGGPIVEDDGKYFLRIALDRKGGAPLYESCELILHRNKMRGLRTVINRILSGEYKFKGSALHYDRGKWFALISYEMPSRVGPDLNPRKVLVVSPGVRVPWRVSICGAKWFPIGGRHNHVGRARKRLMAQRRSRQDHYRNLSSAARGKGRKRATVSWEKLGRGWRFFVRNFNRNIAKRLCEIATREGCGKIVYMQPSEAKRATRYLATVGQVDDFGTRTEWDFFDFGNLLRNRCERLGVELEVRKKTQEKKEGRAKPKRGARKRAS